MIKGFACGVYDLYHPGHVLMLQECKQNCDYLTVALNTGESFDFEINPNKRLPFYSIEERAMLLSSCKYVDRVVIYSTENELVQLMLEGKYDVRFIGDDYKSRPITGGDVIKNIKFINRDHGYSTSNILLKISFYIEQQ